MNITRGPAGKRKAVARSNKIQTHTTAAFFELLNKIHDAGCVVYSIKSIGAGPHYEFDTNYDPDLLL